MKANVSCPHCGELVEIEITAVVRSSSGMRMPAVRPKLRLSEVERLIASSGMMQRSPSRQTLIRMINRGDLDGELSRLGWMVYADSFWRWAGVEAQRQAA